MPKKSLDFKLPIQTRCKYSVRLYDIVSERYINGAFYDRDTDIWWPMQWNWDGKDEKGQKAFDLVNTR